MIATSTLKRSGTTATPTWEYDVDTYTSNFYYEFETPTNTVIDMWPDSMEKTYVLSVIADTRKEPRDHKPPPPWVWYVRRENKLKQLCIAKKTTPDIVPFKRKLIYIRDKFKHQGRGG